MTTTREYRAAVGADPRYVVGWVGLGHLLQHRTPPDLDGAEEAYRTAIRHDPRNFMAHNNLGTCALTRGASGDAEAAFRAAIAVNPLAANAHANLATLLADKPGGQGEARAMAEACLRMSPGHVGAQLVLENRK